MGTAPCELVSLLLQATYPVVLMEALTVPGAALVPGLGGIVWVEMEEALSERKLRWRTDAVDGRMDGKKCTVSTLAWERPFMSREIVPLITHHTTPLHF